MINLRGNVLMDLNNIRISDVNKEGIYRVLVGDDVVRYFKDFKMDEFYLSAKLLIIGVDQLDNFKAAEESFSFVDNNKGVVLVFRFEEGNLILRDIFSSDNLFSRG